MLYAYLGTQVAKLRSEISSFILAWKQCAENVGFELAWPYFSSLTSVETHVIHLISFQPQGLRLSGQDINSAQLS